MRMMEMTDRELLELAAKAAGIVIKEWDYGEPVVDSTDGNYDFNWNPLTDDGDAFRLAVKLHLPVEAMIAFIAEKEPNWSYDPYAATRRAIVRSAAEIGKGTA